jgi:hypothetical protein
MLTLGSSNGEEVSRSSRNSNYSANCIQISRNMSWVTTICSQDASNRAQVRARGRVKVADVPDRGEDRHSVDGPAPAAEEEQKLRFVDNRPAEVWRAG